MAFDEDAADGFRPPPHPDDRLWRHPSELRHVGRPSAERGTPPGDDLTPDPAVPGSGWLGVAGHMALVGGVAVVATAIALAILGVPQRIGDHSPETALSPAASVTTTGPDTTATALWNGSESSSGTTAGRGTIDPAGRPPESDGDPAEEPPAAPAAPEVPTEAEQVETDPRAWLGVDGDTLPGTGGEGMLEGPVRLPGGRSAGSLPGDLDGVLVTNVVDGSPAAPHLRPGSVIVSIDGHPTPDMDALLAALADRSPGDEVDVVHLRLWQSTPVTSTLTLADRP